MANRLLMRAITVVLLAAVPLPAQTAQSAWKYYTYPADGFGISTPTQPTYTSQTRPTDSGNVDFHIYTISLGDTEVTIVSAEIRGLANASADERLQKTKLGALKAGNLTLTTEKKITLGLYPGLQYEATGENLHVRARIYIVGDGLYQLFEVSPLATPFPADAEQISTSFKILITPRAGTPH